MPAMNSSFYFITIFAIIAFMFMYVQSFPLETFNDKMYPENEVFLIPRHTAKRSIYGLYRYIPKMDEKKIKKDDSFEGGYARYYFTE